MKINALLTVITLSSFATVTQAWGPFSNNSNNYTNSWGNGYGETSREVDGIFTMNFSGRSKSSIQGRNRANGYSNYNYMNAPYYGYGYAPSVYKSPAYTSSATSMDNPLARK